MDKSNNKKICIIAFTDNGIAFSQKLTQILPYNVDIYSKQNENVKTYLSRIFNKADVIIFIGAAGIAVRLISPFIKSKDTDPAVIVFDEHGYFGIPILSGHIGGANEFCKLLCEKTGSTPVITTATDINNKFSADTWATKSGCKIEDISKIKYISSSILKNEKIGFYSDYPVLGDIPNEMDISKKNIGICVSAKKIKPFNITLNIVPKTIVIGVGCKKNTNTTQFEEFLLEILSKNNISINAIDKISSIDLKKDEQCIIDFSKKYKIPFIVNNAKKLNSVCGNFTKSQFVKEITGTDNVCERSAVLESNNGKIILPKTSRHGMTVCLAEKEWECRF